MSFAIFTPEAFPRCLDFPPVLTATIRNNRMRYIYIYTIYIVRPQKNWENQMGVVRVSCICVRKTCIARNTTGENLSLLLPVSLSERSFLERVCVYVCVCVYAAIKKSRHDVVASVKGTRYFSLLRYLSELQRSANVPKAFCNSSLEREASARSGTSASAVRDLTVHPISVSTPRKNRNRCSLTMYTTSTYITMLDYTQTVGLVDFSSTCFSRALPRRLRSNMAKKKMFFLIT